MDFLSDIFNDSCVGAQEKDHPREGGRSKEGRRDEEARRRKVEKIS